MRSHGVRSERCILCRHSAHHVGLRPVRQWPISSLTNNALEQSKVGVKIEESFGDGWTAIGKLETDFNPAFGEISDACASLLRNNGKSL